MEAYLWWVLGGGFAGGVILSDLVVVVVKAVGTWFRNLGSLVDNGFKNGGGPAA